MGVDWSLIALRDTPIRYLAIVPGAPTTIYAMASDRGLVKSTDEGVTWITINPDAAVVSVVVDPQIPSNVYAVTSSGLFISTNSGNSWAVSLANFDFWYWWCCPAGTASVSTLAIAPQVDPASAATLYAGLTYVSGGAFSGDTYVWGEAWRSTDGGSSWAGFASGGDPPASLYYWQEAPILAAARLTPTTPATLYTAGLSDCYGVWWMRDEGTSGCGLLAAGKVYSLAVDPLTPTNIYAATNLGVFRSVDAGANWTQANSGLTGLAEHVPEVLILAVDPVPQGTLYAGTSIGVFKTTDGGDTWNPTGLMWQSPLASVSLNPWSVLGGNASTGTVRLLTAAPASGTAVDLSSSHPAIATVPPTVTVSTGTTTATFTVLTNPVTATEIVTVSASLEGARRSVTLGRVRTDERVARRDPEPARKWKLFKRSCRPG